MTDQLRRATLRWGILPVLVLVTLMAVPALPLSFASSHPGVPAGHSLSAAMASAPRPATPVPAAPHPSGGGSSTFFTNTQIPLPANGTCFHGTGASGCANITNEPSINYTSTGVLAVAYTAMTNASPCANASGTAQSEIGFVRSTNLGASWSTPNYLGNTQCASGPAFSSAWEPSLTSLANGTLALAFIEFNLSASSINPYIANYIPNAFEFNTQSSRLVVTESYDGGLNWTTPSVLNSSVVNISGNLLGWAPVRPWISAVGNTIYVAWENLTQSSLYPQSYYPNFGGGASIGAHLLVSTNGGASWGSTIDLPATPGLYYPFRTFVAMNPTVLAAPNGSVYVAFTTNVSAALPCGSICLQNPTTTGDVVVGVSQNNGTTFSWSTLSKTVALDPLWGPYYDPSPQLAVSPTNGQVYATYSAGLPGTYCFPGTFSFCAAAAYGTGVYFANSSDGGRRWSPVHLVDSTLVDSNGGPNDATYNPSLVVDAAGTIHLELSYSQYEPCSGTCILQKQLYYNSTDNGTTFGGGFTISGNYTYSPYEWDGEYDTMAVAGGHLWIAYVQDLCPAWSSSSCFMFGGGTGRAQVTIAMPFHGAGVTLTFSESGLPANSTWSVDMLGNVRSALAPASVSETGVPTGEWVNWSVPWVNVSYGAAFVGTIPASTSFVLGGATTIPVSFSELVRVDIATLPTFNQCYFGQCLNYLLPTLGVSWVPLGTVSTETVTPSVPPTFSQWLNVSFLGWVGTGNGSVTSNFTSVTFTANGPVNETASFLPNAVCSSYGTTTCTGGGTYDITFNETGLPSGVAWSVSADGVTGTSTTSTLDLAVPNGTVQWSAWSVPDGSSNVWAPTSSSPGIVQLPYTSVVNITYTKVTTSAQSFPVQFNEIGLPLGSGWTANLSGALYAFSRANATALVPSATYNLTFRQLLLENGTGYSAQSVFVQPLVMNSTSVNYTSGGRVTVDGPVAITAVFQSTVELTVDSGVGGTATPATQWLVPGTGVTLHESPSAGYAFAGWAGYGPGATSPSQANTPSPTIYPSGPVTEVASFVRLAPARYQLTANASGLPAGQEFTVGLGSRNATSTGTTLSIPNLLPGWYPLTVPDLYANSTGPAQYVFVGAVASGGATLFANGTLQITGIAALTLSFRTEYPLALSSDGPGAISLAAGTYWYDAGTNVFLNATPTSGDRFLGWVGSGAGSFTGLSPSAAITVNAAISEVATFALPPGPPTYTLTVNETGLPTGISWEFVLGATGSSGPSGPLSLAGLSGGYVLNLPIVAGPTDGTRFVPNLTANESVMLTANVTVQASFTEQFRLTVAATQGGTVTPLGIGWYGGGTAVTIQATPSTGQVFAGWAGTGSASYSGANGSAPLTLNSPVSEVASFAAAPPPPTTMTSGGGSGSGIWIALGAFVGLLVVGAVVGTVLFRGRRPPTDGGESSETAPADGVEPES